MLTFIVVLVKLQRCSFCILTKFKAIIIIHVRLRKSSYCKDIMNSISSSIQGRNIFRLVCRNNIQWCVMFSACPVRDEWFARLNGNYIGFTFKIHIVSKYHRCTYQNIFGCYKKNNKMRKKIESKLPLFSITHICIQN